MCLGAEKTTPKGQIQAARNIETGKFPEIMRLTNEIRTPDIEVTSKQKNSVRRHSRKIKFPQKYAIK